VGNKGDLIKGIPLLLGAIGGKGGALANKETISSTKGKNVYIGQWDDIKEKMTWQVMEKGAEVSRATLYGVSARTRGIFSTPFKSTRGRNKEELAQVKW
jgi:hypothetical protein